MNRRDNPNSSVKSKDKVYCVNEEYKYIKKLILERYPSLWNEVKSIYALKKLHNYNFSLSRIAPEFEEQYITDISKEFREDEVTGDLDKSYFTEGERKQLDDIKNDPVGYYIRESKEWARAKIPNWELENTKMELENTKMILNATEMELQRILNTTTYKVGRFIMYIPCSIKDWIIERKNQNK